MGQLITRDPKILGGKPIIAGTRMSVESVLELLASGMEIKEILKEYPFLKRTYVAAAINYAVDAIADKKKSIPRQNQPSDLPAIPHEISR